MGFDGDQGGLSRLVDDSVGHPTDRSIERYLKEPAPSRVGAPNERFDHSGLDVVSKRRPRARLCSNAQATAQGRSHSG
jgi:hypothetical protein